MSCPGVNASLCTSPPTFITSNAGIGGIGILWSFVASGALAAVLVVALLWLDGFLGSDHWRHKASECKGCRFRVTLEDTLLGLSDTQLIASLAMLIARQTQLCRLPVYYYNMVSYYVLIASLTHAATLLMVSRKLRTTPYRVVFRLVLIVAVTVFASVSASPGGFSKMPYGHDPDVALQVSCYDAGLAPPPKGGSNFATLALIVITLIVMVASVIGIVATARIVLDSIPYYLGYALRILLQVIIPLTAAGYGWYRLLYDRQAAVYNPGTSGKIKLSDNSQNEWAFGQVLAVINVAFALLFTLNKFPARKEAEDKVRETGMPPNAVIPRPARLDYRRVDEIELPSQHGAR